MGTVWVFSRRWGAVDEEKGVTSGLEKAIRKRSVSKTLGDATPYTSLSVARSADLARDFGIDNRTVDITALKIGIIPERYARNIKTLTPADQIRLLESRVCIVGAGGLGGSVIDILARIGVGSLTVVDGDRFDDSNLNRQLLSEETLLDTGKAAAAAARVARVNAAVRVRSRSVFLDAANAPGLLESAHVVVDCLDNVISRFVLQDAAGHVGAPMVSAAVGGTFGQITTVFPGDRGLERIYGQREKAAAKGAETSLGNLPTIVNVMAGLQCAEVVKIVLNRPGGLRHRLLIVDLTDYTVETMRLE